MAAFNKVYVNCVADDNLYGLYGYFSDAIDDLKRLVHNNNSRGWGKLSPCASNNSNFPFIKEEDELHYRYFYHDPNCNDRPCSRLVSNRELSLWLARGSGEACYFNSGHSLHDHFTSTILTKELCCFTEFRYHPDEANNPVHIPCGVKLMVRKCGHNDWHEPTAEYLGLKE